MHASSEDWLPGRVYFGLQEISNQGLMPAIAQHFETGQVLMMAYVSPDSLKHTIESNDVWFYSRSRQALWHKGEESGNFLRVKSTWLDCDGDTLLFKVDPVGPACHTGEKSCFFTEFEGSFSFAESDLGVGVLERLPGAGMGLQPGGARPTRSHPSGGWPERVFRWTGTLVPSLLVRPPE